MDQLDTFITEIIDAKQLQGLTEESKAGLREEMRERVLDLINRALIDALPEDKVAEFSALLDAEQTSDETVQSFIISSGVDVTAVTTQVLTTFRQAYLESPRNQ